MAKIHKYNINAWTMHECYINKYIPSQYLVRCHIRAAHVVYSYFVKQSGYESLIFLAYLVLLPPYYQLQQQHMYYSEFNNYIFVKTSTMVYLLYY